MIAEDGKKQTPVIHTDEDWKQRVKAEDAALDQKLAQKLAQENAQEKSAESQQEPGPNAGEEAVDFKNLPPADFSVLVGMFSTQAMVAMGVLPNPATGTADQQLPLARHFIDMLGLLEEKTKGNLDAREASLLNSTLHELRIAFVQKSKTDDNG